ncbi:MAG: M42 family metallopeptidase, partial [Candidatus Korarchaeota archaeon]|nr:M42 family metallopeptidase [Candidatus Korarchaeota archaeon]
MTIRESLQKLSDACGVAGREDEVRDLMKNYLKPCMDEVKEDRLGNIIGIIRGKENAPKVMFAAHMDEIGLLIKSISEKGFLHFAKVG